MPIYEYDCPQCGRLEVMQKASDKPLKTCPTCAERGVKSAVEKIISAAAFHLKGNGWYKSDYANSKSPVTTEKSTSGDAAKSETGGATAEKGEKKTETGKTALKTAGCGSGCKCAPD